MQRLLLIISSSLAILFVAITLVRLPSTDDDFVERQELDSSDEKAAIREFWRVYRQATEHRVVGRTAAAAESYARALKLNERHEDTLYYLGNAYFELGNYRAAEQAWKRLIRINPASARAHYQLGTLYLNVEDEAFLDLDRAEAEFRRALEINQEETRALLCLGRIALIRGQLDSAASYFEAVTGSNYRSVEARFLGGYVAWKNGDLEAASAALRQAVEYSKLDVPTAEVAREGDTKSGTPLLSSARSHHGSPFSHHLEDLSELDPSTLSAGMPRVYRDLDAYLLQFRKRIRF